MWYSSILPASRLFLFSWLLVPVVIGGLAA